MNHLARLIALSTTLALMSTAWGAPANLHLPRARQLLDELRYADAASALEEARAQPGNDHDTLLQILELQGVVAGMLQQPAKARAAFQTLLVLEPDYRLKSDYAPRVVTPFFEAKAFVNDQRAELLVEAVPGSGGEAAIQPLAVQVKRDTLDLSRSVRFHLLMEGGAKWSEQEVPLVQGKASAPMKGERVEWWAELLDEHKAVLATVGTSVAPRVALAPSTRPAAPELTNKPEAPAVKAGSPLRTVGYVCLGLAVAAGAGGAVVGLQAKAARAQVEGAPQDDGGLTTGLTQREAYALDERARSQAQLANVLFGVAGAALIAGGTLWVLGAPVAVAPTPTGVVVSGGLP